MNKSQSNMATALPHSRPVGVLSGTDILVHHREMQLVNVFMCRSERGSVFSAGIAGNKLILAGIAMAVGLILMIDYTLPGNLLFGTAPIPLWAWLVVLPFALLMLGLEEFRKWVVRRKAGLRTYDGPNELLSLRARGSTSVLTSGKAVAVDIPL
jgi:hypothetical protein